MFQQYKNIINMSEESQVLHAAVQKHSCCSVHLKPLLEKINSLEHKLLIEIQRRQNEYNDLLHILVTVKRNKKDENSPGKSNIQIAKPISKLVLTGQMHNKKNKDSSAVANSEVKASSKGKSTKKNSKPLRRSSQNVKKMNITAPIVEPIQKIKQNKDDSIRLAIENHQQQINKLKELSNYLMEQLLILFQKIKEVQNDRHHAASPKSLPTQETLTSIVFDAAQKEAMAKCEINLPEQSRSLEDKLRRLQQMTINNNNFLQDQHAKISEHESILSELIALTRGLSNRIVQIPLYLNSPYDVSPSKS